MGAAGFVVYLEPAASRKMILENVSEKLRRSVNNVEFSQGSATDFDDALYKNRNG
jgi:hypothetical protein